MKYNLLVCESPQNVNKMEIYTKITGQNSAKPFCYDGNILAKLHKKLQDFSAKRDLACYIGAILRANGKEL